jgi:hypothetical protein
MVLSTKRMRRQTSFLFVYMKIWGASISVLVSSFMRRYLEFRAGAMLVLWRPDIQLSFGAITRAPPSNLAIGSGEMWQI